jgi:hypothetical protein
MTKSFLVLLALVLAWGVSIGGAFAGGVALGKGQASNGPEEASRGRAEASAGPSEGAIQGQTVQAAQPIPGQGRRSPAAGGRGPGGRGVTGDIEKVEGDVITIDTQGPGAGRGGRRHYCRQSYRQRAGRAYGGESGQGTGTTRARWDGGRPGHTDYFSGRRGLLRRRPRSGECAVSGPVRAVASREY